MPKPTEQKALFPLFHWLTDRKNHLCIVDVKPEPTELEIALKKLCENPTP